MNEQALWMAGGLVALLAAVWPAYQLLRAVFGNFAGASEVAELKAAVQKLEGAMNVLRDNTVTKAASDERRAEVDRLLEARRIGEREVHERINDHIKTEQEMHAELLRMFNGMASDLSYIKGKLEK